MFERNDEHDRLEALLPFRVGGMEFLLVPNKFDGDKSTVMVIGHDQHSSLSVQLMPHESRRLASYLNAAADEADALNHPPRDLRHIQRPVSRLHAPRSL